MCGRVSPSRDRFRFRGAQQTSSLTFNTRTRMKAGTLRTFPHVVVRCLLLIPKTPGTVNGVQARQNEIVRNGKWRVTSQEVAQLGGKLYCDTADVGQFDFSISSKCRRGLCGHLEWFVPHRKQRYCSPRCSRRTRLERFRSRPSSNTSSFRGKNFVSEVASGLSQANDSSWLNGLVLESLHDDQIP